MIDGWPNSHEQDALRSGSDVDEGKTHGLLSLLKHSATVKQPDRVYYVKADYLFENSMNFSSSCRAFPLSIHHLAFFTPSFHL